MASLRELLTRWTFEVHEEPLERVEHHLESIKDRLEFLAAAEVIKGIYELVEKFAGFAEQLHIAAASAGVTVEALQELSFAASKAGVSQDELGGALARLSRMLYNARRGSAGAQEAFEQAGFTQEQIENLRTGKDAFMALSDKIRGMTDPIQKQAIAMQLLGRGSYNMVGLLDKGSASINRAAKSAGHMGAIVGHEDVEALVEVEHAFSEMFMVIKAFTAHVAAMFAPALKTASEVFVAFFNQNRKFMNLMAEDWSYDFLFALGAVLEGVRIFVQLLLNFIAQYPGVARVLGDLAILLGTVFGAVWIGLKAFRLFRGVITALNVVWGIFTSATLGWVALFIAGVAAVALIIDALWDVFNGKDFKDTKLGKALLWLKGLGKKTLAVLGFSQADVDEIPTIEDAKASAEAMPLKGLDGKPVQGGPESLLDKLSRVSGFDKLLDSQGMQKVLSGVSNMMASPEAMAQPAMSSRAQYNNWQTEAPITINISGASGDANAVASNVRSAVKDAMRQVHRETQRSLDDATEY